TLLDNDGTDNKLSLFVEDVQLLEGPSGTESLATFNVYLSQPVDDLVTIDYTTAPGTASSGSDFAPLSGTLTFAPGQTRAAVQVPVFGDSASEASEEFSLVLSAPVGTPFGAGGAGLVATATIWDDDAGADLIPVLSITDAEVQEGNGSFGPNMEFVLTLSAPTTNTVTVDFQTLNDTALAGEDFIAASNTATFQPGQTSARVAITTLGGSAPEPEETFFLELSNSQNAVLAGGVATLQGIGTILDNDPVPLTSSLTSSLVSEDSLDSTMVVIENQNAPESDIQTSQESDLFVVQELLPDANKNFTSEQSPIKDASSFSLSESKKDSFAKEFLQDQKNEQASKHLTPIGLSKERTQTALYLASTKTEEDLPLPSSPKWMEEFLVGRDLEEEITVSL
ncbi:MAG: hypothetical protein OEY91_04880, partial [Nitrospirota bacterium]|nr:hypothetical protein [Nitrospirota bacterium]